MERLKILCDKYEETRLNLETPIIDSSTPNRSSFTASVQPVSNRDQYLPSPPQAPLGVTTTSRMESASVL